MKRLFYIALVILIIYLWYSNRTITHGPGIIAPNQPIQVNLTNANPFSYNHYTVYPLANYEITARVLSKRNYSFGRESDLSPVDLALGWGPMSDEEVLSKIAITQSQRWYSWYCKEFPILNREIERNSANMHIIPSTSEIREALKKIRKGHLIKLKGCLVKVEAQRDNWRWMSSLTRNDTGQGSCELIWVEELNIL